MSPWGGVYHLPRGIWVKFEPAVPWVVTDDSTTSYRILPRKMEESKQRHAKKDMGGRAIQQVVNHSIAGGGPK
jgi:hypothetical protein